MSSHHIFFKSQYFKKDKDKGWNRVDLSEEVHRMLHHAGNDYEIHQKLIWDYNLKYGAYQKYLKRKNQIGLKDIEYELRKAKYKLKAYERKRHTA